MLATASLAAVSAITLAAPAQADTPTPGTTPGGATATLGGLVEADNVSVNGKVIKGGLFNLAVENGGSLLTYCIDLNHGTRPKAVYQETSWDQSSLANNQDAGKILWILENSYPKVNDLTKLAKDAGVEGTLTKNQAAAATQAAIWHFSDKADAKPTDKDAAKLTEYLEQNAQALQEPKPSITLDPPAVSGKAGEKLGPVKVNTSAAQAEVALDPAAKEAGVKLVDKNGQEVTTAANGSELYFDVPKDAEDGGASLTVNANTVVPVGRAFVAIGDGKGSQTQILAGTSQAGVQATATAVWAKPTTKGPIPAISAEHNCVDGGVDITVTNEGDADFVFELEGKEHTIGAGKTETVLFPVKEDGAYEVKIALPDGSEKVFKGILDCKTETSTGGGSAGGSESPSSKPTPASAGGSSEGGSSSTTGGDNLAETGSSSSTPVIAGVAVALLVVGGGTVFFLRKRKAGTPAA